MKWNFVIIKVFQFIIQFVNTHVEVLKPMERPFSKSAEHCMWKLPLHSDRIATQGAFHWTLHNYTGMLSHYQSKQSNLKVCWSLNNFKVMTKWNQYTACLFHFEFQFMLGHQEQSKLHSFSLKEILDIITHISIPYKVLWVLFYQ